MKALYFEECSLITKGTAWYRLIETKPWVELLDTFYDTGQYFRKLIKFELDKRE